MSLILVPDWGLGLFLVLGLCYMSSGILVMVSIMISFIIIIFVVIVVTSVFVKIRISLWLINRVPSSVSRRHHQIIIKDFHCIFQILIVDKIIVNLIFNLE